MDDKPRTVDEAADELNVSKFTVRAWFYQRKIAHIRLGRCVRIPASEIRRLLEEGFCPARRDS
jgi:excisionase family DNA binding protein